MNRIKEIINAILESDFFAKIKKFWEENITSKTAQSEYINKGKKILLFIFKWLKRLFLACVGFIIFLLILGAIFPTLSCDHDYIEIENVPVTCMQNGKITYKCSKCDKEHTETIKANENAHDYDEDIIVMEATCTSVGKKSKKCIHCGNIIYSEIPKLSHNNIEISRVEPTCTEDGIICFECQDCETKKEEKISKLGHDYGEKVDVPPTCLEIGKIIKVCSRCKKELLLETYGEIGKHDYILAETVNARNGADGYELYRCTVCQDEYKNTLHYYVVYVSRNNVAHSRSDCSGMKYYTVVPKSDASGYKKCEHCSWRVYNCGNCDR